MAKRVWRGDAVKVSQVVRITPGIVDPAVTYGVRINSKDVTAKAGNAAALVTALVTAISASSIPEWREVTASADGGVLVLTSKTPGVPFKVSALVNGFTKGAAIVITVSHSPTGGTWRFDAHEYGYADIGYADSQAAVQSAMDTLYDVGNTLVIKRSAVDGVTYSIEFIGAMAGEAVPPVTVTDGALTGGDAALNVRTIQTAVGGTSEVQTITLFGGATDGTFNITFGGVTITCDHDESTASMQTKARAMASINGANVDITGTAGTSYVWTFKNDLAHRALDPLIVDTSNLTGGSIYAEIETIAEGAPAVNAKFYLYAQNYLTTPAFLSVNYSGALTGGTYSITFPGGVAVSIPWDATNSEIADLIETAYDGTRGCLVSGAFGKAITFVGDLNAFWASAPVVVSSTTGGTVSRGAWATGSGIDLGGGSSDWTIYSYSPEYVSVTLARTASLTEIRAALDAVYGAGNTLVTVMYPESGSWTDGLRGNNMLLVEFVGELAGTNTILTVNTDANLTDSVIAAQYQAGSPAGGVSELQRLTIHGSPSYGDFTLALNGEVTTPLAYNSIALACESALMALLNIGPTDVQASGGPLPDDPVDFVFTGHLGYMDISELAVNDNGLKQRVVRTTPGVTGRNEIQRLSLQGQEVWNGTLTLTFDGDTTAALDYNADVATVVLALETAAAALNFDGSGGPWPEFPIDVEFVNALAETDVPLITATDTLTNGRARAVSLDPLIVRTAQRATGPNHASDGVNWYNPDSPLENRQPERGDDVFVTDGKVDILYGLTQFVDFTVDTIHDWIIPANDHDLLDGQKVEVWTSGGLPSGLSANTDYWVRDLDSITGKFRLSATATGDAINITTSGTPTHHVGVRLNSYLQLATYQGKIGLSWNNKSGYKEYRALDLHYGVLPGGTKTFTIGQGSGSGSGLTNIDTADEALTLEVLAAAGSSDTSRPAIHWIGDNAAVAVNVYGGDFGIARRPTESATFGPLQIRGGTVSLGTVTFASVDQTGGTLDEIIRGSISGVVQKRG